ncbi:MAG: patatin-like phospholipase family protein, partial [bacterium]
MARKLKIGLALGGGGARGLAHLGVLRALSNVGIEPAVMAGTSMGAIIAVGFVQERKYPDMEQKFKEFVLEFGQKFRGMNYIETKNKEEVGIFGSIMQGISSKMKMAAFVKKLSLEDSSLLDEIVKKYIYPCNIEDLEIPVYLSALDMVSGRGVFFNRGSTRAAVKASMSIAGYFPGVNHENMELYDAQGVFPVPIQAFKFANIDAIIACSVDRRLEQE